MKKPIALFLPAVLVTCIAASPFVEAEQATPSNQALAQKITQLFDEDQAVNADTNKAVQDATLHDAYKSWVKRALASGVNPNFYFPQVYELWAQSSDAPPAVQHYVNFRQSTNRQIEAIVREYGWPQRAAVGDVAAAEFLFLFGHADDDNAWRLTQVPEIDRVSQQDHWNSRCFAHLRDRLAVTAGQPQLYGTVMGPDYRPDAPPHSARLYSPLVDNTAAADRRRASIGLPSIQTDLDAFSHGADIGVFMIPMLPGATWKNTDVFIHAQTTGEMRSIGNRKMIEAAK